MRQAIDRLKEQSRNSKKGLLLIEVLIAAMLVIALWAAASQVFFSVRTGNSANRNLTLAISDLSMVMERLQALSRADLLTNFSPSWNNTGTDEQPSWQVASQEVSSAIYTLIGEKKIGDTDSEKIEYLYENYLRNPTDPVNVTPPALLEVRVTVSWTEKGQTRSQFIRNVLN